MKGAISSKDLGRAGSHSGRDLLSAVRNIRASVGDNLNDDELTHLLQRAALPEEAGFAFLSYYDRFVMMSVPPQNLDEWYGEDGWVVAEKERIARRVAEKYDLSLGEAPDMHFRQPAWADAPEPHHRHLEFSKHRGTVMVVHPQFLKVRQFYVTNGDPLSWSVQRPLLLGADLLQDLAIFYKSSSQALKPGAHGGIAGHQAQTKPARNR